MTRILQSLIAVLSVLLVIWLCRLYPNRENYLWTPSIFVTLVVLPLLYLFLCVVTLIRGWSAQLNLILITFSCIVALYVSEFILILLGPHITLPKEFDRRSKLQVVLDQRAAGIPALPSVHPKDFLENLLEVDGEKLMPLSGVSNAPTVFCNETGKYYNYESDEYGFNNPKGLYEAGKQLDLILLGDSFTQGFCAPDGTSYAERIRQHYPATLNLGNNGDGAIEELASLQEYATPLKTKYVFLFYFEGNDPEDMSRELQNPVLKKYYDDPSFTQNLKINRDRNDGIIRKFIEDGIQAELKRRSFSGFLAEIPNYFRLWLRIWHVRALMGVNDPKRDWKLYHWNYASTEEQVQEALYKIFSRTKQTVEQSGAKFVVVYLPSYRTFGYNISHPWRERFMKLLKDLQIETIDLLPVFRNYPDTFSLYAYRKEGHYTAKGNEVVAQAVLKYLENAGLNATDKERP